MHSRVDKGQKTSRCGSLSEDTTSTTRRIPGDASRALGHETIDAAVNAARVRPNLVTSSKRAAPWGRSERAPTRPRPGETPDSILNIIGICE